MGQTSRVYCGTTPGGLGERKEGKKTEGLILRDFKPRGRGLEERATANGIQVMGGLRGETDPGQNHYQGLEGERENHVIQT